MTDQTPIQTETATHPTIAAALAAAQSEMGAAKKSAKNPHFKTKYADLDAVTDAAMPALNRHGIAVVQPMERVGEEWVLVTRFIHGTSGETLETPVPIIMGKRDMQGLGSAMTYARRYGLMSLAGIAPEDDDGNGSVDRGGQNKGRDPEPPAFNARATADRLITAINKSKGDKPALLKLWEEEKAALSKLPDDLFNEVKTAFSAAAPAAPAADLGGDEIPY